MIMKKNGFSLLELTIYIGLISAISLALVGMFFSVNRGRGNISAKTAVDSNLRHAIEKMEQDLRSASDVSIPEEAGATSTMLVMTIGGDSITYEVSGGKLQRKVNAGEPETITDDTVEVTSSTTPLVFSRLENNNPNYSDPAVSIQIQMNMAYKSTSPDWQYNQTKKTSVLLR